MVILEPQIGILPLVFAVPKHEKMLIKIDDHKENWSKKTCFGEEY